MELFMVTSQGKARPQGRPSIPRDITRRILVEAGHRCAVCGVPSPLERAHIVPWHNRNSHREEDLICLCANCHQRADLEKWGEKTLREYKLKPWVMRQNNCGTEVGATTRLEMVIDIEIEDFDDYKENMLRHALAGFLKISPQSVCIRAKEKGSTRITIDLPEAKAKELLDKFKSRSPELETSLAIFKLLDLEKSPKKAQISMHKKSRSQAENDVIGVREEMESLLKAAQPELKNIFARYQIPAHDAEDLLQEAILTTLAKWEEFVDREVGLLVNLRNRCVVYWRKRRSEFLPSDSGMEGSILEKLGRLSADENSEVMRDLGSLIESLPPRCRKLLQLRYGLGYDTERVAEEMAEAPSSVRVATRRCMSALILQMVARGFASEADSETDNSKA